MSEKAERDIEKVYLTADFAAKLRRLADALESGKVFVIQVAGERIRVPARASISIEHERGEEEEELEFQLKWALKDAPQAENDEEEAEEDDEQK